MSLDTNHGNPIKGISTETEVFCADLATNHFINQVLEILPKSRRDDLSTVEAQALIRHYIFGHKEVGRFTNPRGMMRYHICEWRIAQDIDRGMPVADNILDRFLDWFIGGRASHRKTRELHRYADALLVDALTIRVHVLTSMLRASNGNLTKRSFDEVLH